MKDAVRLRFVADAMLGSLARKLRILGFDTHYYREGDDNGIIRLAVDEGRVILTADEPLVSLAIRRGATAVLLSERTDFARLKALTEWAEALGVFFEKGGPRCSICNGVLTRVPKSVVAGKVPSSVASRHRIFYRCDSCGKVYWKGGHWKKLRSYERVMREAR